MKTIEWERFKSLVHRALADGATLAELPKVEHDISLNCENPYFVFLRSWPPTSLSENDVYDDATHNIRTLVLHTPCRKCETCNRNRSRLWYTRAIREIMFAPRTWFCTFTINPHYRFVFSARSGTRDFHGSYREISKEITKYFKRLRKKGNSFRYLSVAESHKDGFPHVHMLIHETSLFAPITKRTLEADWPFGFTQFKLVEDYRAASYITKYLAKDMRARVRASISYGEIPDTVSISSTLIPD